METVRTHFYANPRLSFSACALVILLGFVFFFGDSNSYGEARTIARGARDFPELQLRFRDLAEKKGAAYAYEVLKRAQLPPNSDLHLLGHTVGDVLYKQSGIAGISLCTDDFRNACSHTIVIGALKEHGETALDMIRDACRKAPGGTGAYTMCFHGLGHGVFAYYDYEFPDTISFCEKTGTSEYRNREYIECVGGAVMELMGGGGHDPNAWDTSRQKYLNTARPLSPCMDPFMPDDAKAICLMYLTPRLFELAGGDLAHPRPEIFPNAFAFCDAIPRRDEELRDACYGGFGKEFAVLAAERDIRDLEHMTDIQISNVVLWCRAATAADGAQSCLRSALQSFFWGGENDPELSSRLCALAKPYPDLENACYEQLAEDIAKYKKVPEKNQLCARLPLAVQSKCNV